MKPKFYQCGICEWYHSVDWNDDCREGDARFDPNELDSAFGRDGWEEVPMPGTEGQSDD